MVAGLPDAGLVAEPVAAALYYAVGDHLPTGAVVAVYDLGGGTFDATVVHKTADGVEIVGTPDGDDRCGGLDIDDMVVALVADAVGSDWPAETDDPVVMHALAQVRAAAVEAKEALSSDTAAVVPVMLPGVVREVRVTRGELEDAVRPTIRHTVAVLRRACVSAGVDPAELHSVLLVGGSSRIPLVAQAVTRELGRPVAVDAHPKFAVCLGAAVAGAARLPGAPTAPAPRPPAPVTRPSVRGGEPATALLPPAVAPPAWPPSGPGPGADHALPGVPGPGAAHPPAAGTVALVADLAGAALTAPADRPLPRPGRPRDPVAVAPHQAPLVVRVGGSRRPDGEARTGRPRAASLGASLGVALVVALVIAAVAVLVVR